MMDLHHIKQLYSEKPDDPEHLNVHWDSNVTPPRSVV